jgi:hypothetical protein
MIVGEKISDVKRVFIVSTNMSEAFLILRGIERDIIVNVHRVSCKVPTFLSDFNKT